MTKNIQSVLSPLLIISYVCGLRVIEFPTGHSKPWFGAFYMLLLWLLYYSIYICRVLPYTANYSITYHFSFGANIFMMLLSIAMGMYYDKKFKNCLKKLTIIDDTLEKLGTTTDYQELQSRIILHILGWSILFVLITYVEAIILKAEHNSDITTTIYVPLAFNVCTYSNFISDLIVASILEYIGLKFDQINEHLAMLTRDNKCGIKSAWRHPMSSFSRQWPTVFPKAAKNEFMTWIILHLHSDLCKISREIDSIFGIQMTFAMGCYLSFLTMDSQELFNVILVDNYLHNKILYIVLLLFWISQSCFRLLLINYMYERVSSKASSTGHLMNKLSHCNYSFEVHENIAQLLLQMIQAPLRFRGLGLFQFGFKFLYRVCTSIATVVVILIQRHTNKCIDNIVHA